MCEAKALLLHFNNCIIIRNLLYFYHIYFLRDEKCIIVSLILNDKEH